MAPVPPLLIVLPCVAGACLLCVRSDTLRRILVAMVTLVVCGATVLLAVSPAAIPPVRFSINRHWLDLGTLALEVAMALYVIYVGVRSKRPLIVVIMLAQSALMVWFECTFGSHIEIARNLFIDNFAVIMAMINGLVGGAIFLYALDYMRQYQSAHPEIADRRPLFFALLFVFMGAMFGLVFANNLIWLFLFWEITTLCSFLLIGYTQTDEARNNALRALVMNVAGGLAFAAAIVWFYRKTGSVELQTLIASRQSLVLLPAALLCFAGITKAAQMPFSSWLLGAMVAPTPVSALLHSSTMVKAGVYLILRLAPVVAHTRVGLLVALVGGVTFVIGSLAAITTSQAKRVLAYSTVANLGLIVLCGGLGTAEAVWAGILLIIFHAIAKCLLFLCVGVVEHKLHSRDIEAMSGLIVKMPQVAVMMLVGMAGMFLAPFGMLISKWAVLKAVVDASPMLTVFIVFGSSATLFFWAKWMGKLLQVVEPCQRIGKELGAGESLAIYGLGIATFLACLFFPLISSNLIEPYVRTVYGQSGSFSQGNLVILGLMMAIVLLFPISFVNYGRHAKIVGSYLGGANLQGGIGFSGSAGEAQSVVMQNYYLRELLDEASLSRWGAVSCAMLLTGMVVVACL
ncbi:MAG: proton-conducting transporter membrane subunit [Tepidisphaeraceae bacterium]